MWGIEVASRTKQVGTKIFVVSSDLHAIYRRASFDGGVPLRKLIDLILRSVANEGKINDYVAELQNDG